MARAHEKEQKYFFAVFLTNFGRYTRVFGRKNDRSKRNPFFESKLMNGNLIVILGNNIFNKKF